MDRILAELIANEIKQAGALNAAATIFAGMSAKERASKTGRQKAVAAAVDLLAEVTERLKPPPREPDDFGFTSGGRRRLSVKRVD